MRRTGLVAGPLLRIFHGPENLEVALPVKNLVQPGRMILNRGADDERPLCVNGKRIDLICKFQKIFRAQFQFFHLPQIDNL